MIPAAFPKPVSPADPGQGGSSGPLRRAARRGALQGALRCRAVPRWPRGGAGAGPGNGGRHEPAAGPREPLLRQGRVHEGARGPPAWGVVEGVPEDAGGGLPAGESGPEPRSGFQSPAAALPTGGGCEGVPDREPGRVRAGPALGLMAERGHTAGRAWNSSQ